MLISRRQHCVMHRCCAYVQQTKRTWVQHGYNNHSQIAKLLVIPFVCFVEYTWFSRRFPPAVVAAVSVVAVGVGIVYVGSC